jgi:DNA-binding transcriptional LysR family regulator
MSGIESTEAYVDSGYASGTNAVWQSELSSIGITRQTGVLAILIPKAGLHLAIVKHGSVAMSECQMDLTQLRTLIQVAELGSMNKAADRLRIAQPALSRQIRLLEEELNARLFVRHGRGMALTPAGEKVFSRAKSILAEVEEIRSDVEADRGDVEGRVVIGLPPTVAEIITMPLSNAIHEQHPRLRLHITPGFGGFLLEWLQRGDIDLAVLYNTKPFSSFRVTPLIDERLYVVGSAARGFDLTKPVNFAQVAREPLVLPGPKHSLRMLVERVAHAAGIEANIRYEIESLAIIRDLVTSGYGITVLPFSGIYADLRAGRMSAAPIVEPDITRNLIVACASDRVLTRSTTICEALLTRTVKQLQSQGIWPDARLATDGLRAAPTL